MPKSRSRLRGVCSACGREEVLTLGLKVPKHQPQRMGVAGVFIDEEGGPCDGSLQPPEVTE